MQRLQAENDLLLDESGRLGRTAAALVGECESARQQLTSQPIYTRDASTRSRLEDELVRARADLAAASATAETLKSDNERLVDELERAVADVGDAAGNCNDLESELARMKADLAAASATAESLKSDNERLVDELERAKAKLAEAVCHSPITHDLGSSHTKTQTGSEHRYNETSARWI